MQTNVKTDKIQYIKNVLSDYGCTNTKELELDYSPLYKSINKDHFQLIEELMQDYVRVIEYIHETEIDEFEVTYEELEDNLIDEIYEIILKYEAIQEKTTKRCQD